MAWADPENFPDGGTGGDTIENFGLFSLTLLCKLKKFELFMGDWGGGGLDPVFLDLRSQCS